MSKLLVLDVVCLTRNHLGEHSPNLSALAGEGFLSDIVPVLPAVTCPVQSTMVTGKPPSVHGIVGNGWYFRDLAEVWFWRQSNRLVQAGKIWEELRERKEGFTAAKLFWWYNMYATVDWAVTVKPHYPCDGRKIPGVYTKPPNLEKELEQRFGRFPLFNFWGPQAGIASTRWIAESSRWILERFSPDLTLVYLPHLDYDFQRFGPNSTQAREAVTALDGEAGRLLSWARAHDYTVLVVAEYAMNEVTQAVMINRILREHGFVQIRESLGTELLDFGASRAFAVVDHQIAHVYVKQRSDIPSVRELLSSIEGIEEVLDEEGKRRHGIDHERSGELVALSSPGRWFAYPWWLDDRVAPDFARTVDIHRKPGYDPVELFFDPKKPAPKLRAALKLVKRSLGFRTVFNLTGFETSMVRGSHGVISQDNLPCIIGSDRRFSKEKFGSAGIFELMKNIVLD